ncbi:MAG: DUF952 domain-containing protein [Sandarakinorhabdus sp.]|nr:DUF952 domain-containing protein [Sandarakinorhabdus sp.]
MLFKILRAPEWARFEALGRFEGSADDLRDGFIHLSDAGQVDDILRKHFADESGLVIAELALGTDPALRWEPSRGGALFPHLYRPLLMADLTGWRLVT